jgi:hypothetical protein
MWRFALRSLLFFAYLSAGLAMLLTSHPSSAQLPSPTSVPGKELSADGDTDMAGSPDNLQNLRWQGNGATINAFDYSNSGPPPTDPDQVDALGNTYDYLFQPIVNNQATMVVSFKSRNDVHFHTPNQTTGVWANAGQVSTSPLLVDVDALEMWTSGEGQAPLLGGDDAVHFSIAGDHIPPVPPGMGAPPISVYYYDPGAMRSFTYIPFVEVWQQLASLLNIPPNQLEFFEPDIDAMMVYDLEGATQPPAGGFLPTWQDFDEIIFSVRPDSTFGLDGGELFHWIRGVSMGYLNYGGRIWDTNNPVGTIFGVGTEDINALEAIVPEPSGLALLLVGTLVMCRFRKTT